jgi:hypothetical protein
MVLNLTFYYCNISYVLCWHQCCIFTILIYCTSNLSHTLSKHFHLQGSLFRLGSSKHQISVYQSVRQLMFSWQWCAMPFNSVNRGPQVATQSTPPLLFVVTLNLILPSVNSLFSTPWLLHWWLSQLVTVNHCYIATGLCNGIMTAHAREHIFILVYVW